MKRAFNILALLSILFFSHLALSEETADAEGSEENGNKMDIVLGGGFTFGGDDLLNVEFIDGTTETLDAGGLLDLKVGVEYFLEAEEISIQSTLGYHFDTVSASNGDATFSRFPIDVIGFYHLDRHRAGFGLSYHLLGELEIDFESSEIEEGTNGTFDVDNAFGWVLEYGYRLQNSPLTFAVRAMQIDYEPSNGSGDIDGSHFGLYAYLNFE